MRGTYVFVSLAFDSFKTFEDEKMKNVFLAALAALALSLAPAMAFAGGGSKNTGSINVVNGSAQPLAVFLDAGGNIAAINALPAGTLTAGVQAQFNAAGGVIVDPGSAHLFSNLQAGNHTVTGEILSAAGATQVTGPPTTVNVNVQKGQTRTVTFTGTNTGIALPAVNGSVAPVATVK
jgi:hypothetical protein